MKIRKSNYWEQMPKLSMVLPGQRKVQIVNWESIHVDNRDEHIAFSCRRWWNALKFLINKNASI